MPYIKSRARKTFEADVLICIEAIRLSRGKNIPHQLVREYVLSNAVLRCSACIEGYLEDLISDWIDQLNVALLKTDKIPKSVRVRHVLSDPFVSAFKRYIAFDDERQFSTLLEGHLGASDMLFFVDGLQCPPLNAEKIYKSKKFPSIKNIRTLFARTGIAKIFQQLGKAAKQNMELLLQSFNDVRNAFAHDGMPVGLNAVDVRNKIRDAKLFVQYVDRVFYRHVCEVSGNKSWVAQPAEQTPKKASV